MLTPSSADSLSTARLAPHLPPDCAIRVFIAEDHAITLWGLQQLIDASRPRMKVVGTAATCQTLLNHPALREADVILLDLDLAGENSGESLADLQRCCSAHVIVLTGNDKPDTHRDMALGGARGVLHKSEPADTILRAIAKVHEGEVWLHRSLLGEVLGRLTGRAPAARSVDPAQRRIDGLTPREGEIVARMVLLAGAKQVVIAADLCMSEHTLRNHLTTIYSKLEVRGRLELHVFATSHGMAAGSRAARA